LSSYDEGQDLLTVRPYLSGWVRGLLLALSAGWVLVFGLAWYLNPYQEDGSPRTLETHRQLGFPPCTFRIITGGLPCPSCGMTTSFSLLVHGDPVNSLRANWVGTLLAVYGLVLIPWSLVSVLLKQPLFILSLDRALNWSVIIFLALMLLRWSLVIGRIWWDRLAF
jgi:hypothetical protein